jgi:uncharacterized membrane protein
MFYGNARAEVRVRPAGGCVHPWARAPLGRVFLVPLAGPTLGAAAGAVAGGLADFGLDDDFVLRVREAVTPGSSAPFVVSSRAAADRLAAEHDGLGATVVRAELSHRQAEQLREALAEE